MANKSKVQSVEPDIADLVNGWLKSYGLDYKLEQASLKNEQPDYELMSTLISAIQKLVIADVVKFSDEKIKATKQVVG